VSAIAITVFCLTWWMACYLIGRDPARPALQRASAALAVYAVAVAAWTIAPDSAVAEVLLCVPALIWAGAAIGLIPPEVPERRQIDRGWMILTAIFVVMIAALPSAGKVVALAPLIGALALLWRAREVIRPTVLPVAISVVAALFAAGLIVMLAPVDVAEPAVVLAAIGLDLIVLGYLVAVADAVEAGERLHPDLRRSAAGAVVATLLCGGPAALTTLAAPGVRAVVVLQFVVVAVVMGGVGLTGPIRRFLDRLAFLHDDRLRLDRAALLLSAEALPRRRERHRLLTVSEDDFLQLTSRALDDFGDLGRLLRSPLIDLPTVDRRLRGPAAEQPLARAVELRAVLQESIARLKPDGLFGTTEEWRYYNALHYCCVLGLRPYARHPQTTRLDRDARRAFDWFRRYVPRRALMEWQREGARLVADRLWNELVSTDPRWLTRASAGNRASATRST
jgi:hypothetical protein